VTNWAEGVEALLPRTDRIGLTRKGRATDLLLVPWPVAEQIVGARMEPVSFVPARVRVRSFPNGAELARPRSRAIP
jgi:hypothetical protein